jgi:hypothetical protein
MDRTTKSTTTTSTDEDRPHRARRRDALGRVGFTINEAARALGMKAPALRRLVERHAEVEGDEHVARLTGGILARKRKGLGRWLVIIPSGLRQTGATD